MPNKGRKYLNVDLRKDGVLKDHLHQMVAAEKLKDRKITTSEFVRSLIRGEWERRRIEHAISVQKP